MEEDDDMENHKGDVKKYGRQTWDTNVNQGVVFGNPSNNGARNRNYMNCIHDTKQDKAHKEGTIEGRFQNSNNLPNRWLETKDSRKLYYRNRGKWDNRQRTKWRHRKRPKIKQICRPKQKIWANLRIETQPNS